MANSNDGPRLFRDPRIFQDSCLKQNDSKFLEYSIEQTISAEDPSAPAYGQSAIELEGLNYGNKVVMEPLCGVVPDSLGTTISLPGQIGRGSITGIAMILPAQPCPG